MKFLPRIRRQNLTRVVVTKGSTEPKTLTLGRQPVLDRESTEGKILPYPNIRGLCERSTDEQGEADQLHHLRKRLKHNNGTVTDNLRTQRRKQDLRNYFTEVSGIDKDNQVRRLFQKDKDERTRQRKLNEAAGSAKQGRLHQHDVTYGFITQNVNGFGATEKERRQWFTSVGEKDEHGRGDVRILQETHVTASEIDLHQKRFAARWGFRRGRDQPEYSFWSPANNRKAGVAILIDPYGAFKEAAPYLEELWTPHFMAVTGTLNGKSVVVCNLYAPHLPAPREAFFASLQSIVFPADTLIMIGGDFNCTLDDPVDRTYQTKGGHDSPALRALLNLWRLLDPVAVARPTRWTNAERQRHQLETHTYHYKIQDKGIASSRLDRWYVSANTLPWVAAWHTVSAGADTDHLGVKLHIRSPDDAIRVRRPAKLHPVPEYAKDAVTKATEAILTDFGLKVQDQSLNAQEAAAQWDQLKVDIAKTTRKCIRESKSKLRGSLKQKLLRLVRQQQRLDEDRLGIPPSVEGITDQLDGLSLDDMTSPTRAARLKRAIAECKQQRGSIGRQRLFRQQTHWTGKTTRAMFKRVSNKFADNSIHRLDPVAGSPVRNVHDKANTLADAWTPILQQPPAAEKSIDEVLAWIEQATGPTPEQEETATPITDIEVAAAINSCTASKAAGPDRLGNGWYRDYAEQLTPILTRLLNLWYDAGHFPETFLQADIFCLKKGGNLKDALNFRPLALLNTDYKIFTRILATRVSPTLAEQIHENQNGFVPGRNIHDTLDLYEAAQGMAEIDPRQSEATAMLLDFKKAYDSVDRNFIVQTLAKKGYPAKFIRAVQKLHDGTTVRFLANGEKSLYG